MAFIKLPEAVSLDLDPDDTSIDQVEKACKEAGYHHVIGVDEVGRGPVAGPVTVAATYLGPDILEQDWTEGLNDSKKLSEKARKTCQKTLFEHAPAYYISSRSSSYIDKNGIAKSIKAAMVEAVTYVIEMMESSPDLLLIDGISYLDLDLPQIAIKKGDSKSLHIAASSILAKTHRDAKMCSFHEQWPDYGFDSHKGYGTASHFESLEKKGPCPIHRYSINRIRKLSEKKKS